MGCDILGARGGDGDIDNGATRDGASEAERACAGGGTACRIDTCGNHP